MTTFNPDATQNNSLYLDRIQQLELTHLKSKSHTPNSQDPNTLLGCNLDPLTVNPSIIMQIIGFTTINLPIEFLNNNSIPLDSLPGNTGEPDIAQTLNNFVDSGTFSTVENIKRNEDNLLMPDGKMDRSDLEIAIKSDQLSDGDRAAAKYLLENFDLISQGKETISDHDIKLFAGGVSARSELSSNQQTQIQAFANNTNDQFSRFDIADKNTSYTPDGLIGKTDLQAIVSGKNPEFSTADQELAQLMLNNFDTLSQGDDHISQQELKTFANGLSSHTHYITTDPFRSQSNIPSPNIELSDIELPTNNSEKALATSQGLKDFIQNGQFRYIDSIQNILSTDFTNFASSRPLGDGKISHRDLEKALKSDKLSGSDRTITEFLLANFDHISSDDKFITNKDLNLFSDGVKAKAELTPDHQKHLLTLLNNENKLFERFDTANKNDLHTQDHEIGQKDLAAIISGKNPNFTEEDRELAQWMLDNLDTLSQGDKKLTWQECSTFVNGMTLDITPLENAFAQNNQNLDNSITALQTAIPESQLFENNEVTLAQINDAIQSIEMSPDERHALQILSQNFNALKGDNDSLSKEEVILFANGLAAGKQSPETFDSLSEFSRDSNMFTHFDGAQEIGSGKYSPDLIRIFLEENNAEVTSWFTDGEISKSDLDAIANDIKHFTPEQQQIASYLSDNIDKIGLGDGKITQQELSIYLTGMKATL